MSWVKIDDSCPEHRKLLAAGAAACWLWVCGLAYCNRQKHRDGFIPSAKVPLLYPIRDAKSAALRLEQVGLWTPTDGGFLVHDYHEYQPSAEKEEANRSAKSLAGRLGGLRSGESRRASKQEAELEAAASSKTNPRPVPSRPDPEKQRSETFVSPDGEPVLPTASKPVESHPVGLPRLPKAVACRIPEDWKPSPGLMTWCRSEGVDRASAEAEVPAFIDYWRGIGGEKGRKLDWDGTFRNRIREQIKRGFISPRAREAPSLLTRLAIAAEEPGIECPEEYRTPEMSDMLKPTKDPVLEAADAAAAAGGTP